MVWMDILVMSLICGLMGAWTGANGSSKLWRRLMIPIVLTVFAYITLNNHLVVEMLLMFPVLSIGYGIPTPPNDPGSGLGSFWYKICKGNGLMATGFTRATIGVLLIIANMSIPVITGAWWPVFGVFAGVFLFNQLLWTVIFQGLGMFNFLGKSLNTDEFCLYTTDALIIMTMIVMSV